MVILLDFPIVPHDAWQPRSSTNFFYRWWQMISFQRRMNRH